MGGFIGYSWLCCMCGESGDRKSYEQGWPCSCALGGESRAKVYALFAPEERHRREWFYDWEIFEMRQTAGMCLGY